MQITLDQKHPHHVDITLDGLFHIASMALVLQWIRYMLLPKILNDDKEGITHSRSN